MKKTFLRCVAMCFLLMCVILPAVEKLAAQQEIRDIFPDTWVGTDALGRTMPTETEVGDVKRDQRRVVGIFYITWHGGAFTSRPKHPLDGDVTKILQADPAARLDANHPNWLPHLPCLQWGEPEMGYFRSDDEYVIRKDMSMLADAGIDVVIFDVTNAVRYWHEWDVILETMCKMEAEGSRVPRFCFWSFNGPSITVVQELYDKIYKPGRFKELWFYWDDKPLLLYNSTPSFDANRGGITHPNPHYDAAAKTDSQHPHFGDSDFTEEFYKDYTKEVREFFTLRTMWWGYYKWGGKRFIGTEDNWSFGYDMGDPNVRSLSPEELLSLHDGRREQAAVTPAQHSSSLIGKSWSKEHGEPELDEYDMPKSAYVPWLGKTVEHPEGYGIYFQERWEDALKANPQFLYINDWNEWVAGKYTEPGTLQAMNFMRRGKDAAYFFVDQYNAEFNRGIQPMKGGYTDNYYMQMAQNIRRYKGARSIPKNKGEIDFDTARPFAAWDKLEVEYRDTRGDVFHRDHDGYSGHHYTDTSGRNDMITCKVGVDAANVYFYVETAEKLTPSTDENWMLLFIDADRNSETGWFGYDLLVNKKMIDGQSTMLMKWDTSSGQWKDLSPLTFAVESNKLVVKLPRSVGGWEGDSIGFDFKWSDNPNGLNDPISFCTGGDTAPNRRFNYRFLWEK